MLVDLPPFNAFMSKVAELVEAGQFSHTQLIILRICYKATKAGAPKHFNYLLKATAQTKEDLKWELNDLLKLGAIKQTQPNWYML